MQGTAPQCPFAIGGAPDRGPFTNVSKPHLLLGCLLAVHLAMRILPNRTTHPL